MVNYSVLMSVYFKENPEYLRESMMSMLNQTLPTNDFVLVCDGPLGDELEEVILKVKEHCGSILNIVRLEENKGLGVALNIGMQQCKNELIARMDSDDISHLDRCEKQVEVFISHPETDILSCAIEEFIASIDNIESRRSLPETHAEIVEYAKERCPFNHPCVMYRKSAVEAVGGYQHFYLLEDYYLWIRLLQSGAIGYNLKESLLWMRTGPNMYKRRGGRKYAWSLIRLHLYMVRTDYISKWKFLKLLLIRTVSCLLPNGVRTWVYKRFLRSSQ